MANMLPEEHGKLEPPWQNMNEPIDHHYIPVFYLSRWAGTDGRVCRFSRPYQQETIAKRLVPKGTAFEPGLYSAQDQPPQLAQTMEKHFMAPLDMQAAKALDFLESAPSEKDWTSGLRSSWSRFMLTQMLRAPEDIAQLKSATTQDWSSAIHELEAIYAAQRLEGDPETVQEYLSLQSPGEIDKLSFKIARTLMDHPAVGQTINNMHWIVLNVSKDELPLLTSDRPIWMTTTFFEEDAFISMPIGPRKLFLAAPQISTIQRIEMRSRRQLVKAVNKIVVQHSVKFVYGIDNRSLKFVQKHMATRRHASLLERLAVRRGHEIVADIDRVIIG